MHFSRNPPGPKTSCMEAFAVSAPRSPTPMDVLNPPSRSRESPSTGTNLRSTVFIACLAFPAVVSLLELLFFLARSSPCPAEGDAGAATIAYPSLALAPPSPGDALDGLPSEDVSLRAFHGF